MFRAKTFEVSLWVTLLLLTAISHHASSSSHRHVDPPVPHFTPQTDGKLDEALKELGVIDAAVQQWRESMGDGAKQSQTEAEPEVFEQVQRRVPRCDLAFLPVLHTYRVLAVATQVEFSVKKTHVPKKCTKYDVQHATPMPHRCHCTTARTLPTPAHHPTHTPLQSDAIRRCAASALCWQAAQWQGVCL